VVRIPLARELTVVAWVPAGETATASARRLLPEQVSFDDAGVQRRSNGSSGRGVGPRVRSTSCASRAKTGCIRAADSLVRGTRTPRWRPCSKRARSQRGSRDPARRRPAFVDRGDAERIAAALPKAGRVLVLDIDDEGAVIT